MQARDAMPHGSERMFEPQRGGRDGTYPPVMNSYSVHLRSKSVSVQVIATYFVVRDGVLQFSRGSGTSHDPMNTFIAAFPLDEVSYVLVDEARAA